MKKHWSLFLGLVALLAWPFAAQAQPPRFSANVTYNEMFSGIEGRFVRAANVLIQLNARLPMNIDPRSINETTALWLDFGAFGQDVLCLGMDSEYVRGTNRARITSPGISLDLSWTKTNLTIAGNLMIAQSPWPHYSPSDGVSGPFSGQDNFYVGFGSAAFSHAFEYHGTNTARSNYSDSGQACFSADLIPPVVTIRAPRVVDAADGSGPPAPFSMTVIGTDNGGLAPFGEDYKGQPVYFQLSWNGDEFATCTRGGTPTTFPVNLNVGTNVFAVRAQDWAGNYTTNSVEVFCSRKSALALTISPAGAGTASGLPADLMLEEGRNYTATARVTAQGEVFKGWYTAEGELLSTSPRYTFRMTRNLGLRVHFATNAFLRMAGSYRCTYRYIPLFPSVQHWREPWERDTQIVAGLVSITLTKHGVFSGKLQTLRGDIPLLGAFSDNEADGSAFYRKDLVLANGDRISLALDLYRLNEALPEILQTTMTLSFANGHEWWCFGQGSKVGLEPEFARGVSGVYNFVIPNGEQSYGGGLSTPGPIGMQYGSFTVQTNGFASGVIHLPDGSTPVLFGGRLLEDGSMPIYRSLYNNNGLFLFKFSVRPGIESVETIGYGDWIKLPNAGPSFTNGFGGWCLAAYGAKWRRPTLGQSGTVDCWVPGQSPRTIPVTVRNSRIAGLCSTDCDLVFTSFNPRNGVFSGTFLADGAKATFSGICCGSAADPSTGNSILSGGGFCVLDKSTGLFQLNLSSSE